MLENKKNYFVALDKNDIVENYCSVEYTGRLIEYCNCDHLHTRNWPDIGSRYDESINAFIPLKQDWMDDTYTFNAQTLKWDPNPDLIYYHIEGIPHKWNPETESWYRVDNLEEPPAE